MWAELRSPNTHMLKQGEVTPIDSVQTPATGVKRGQAVKAENLEGQAVKDTSQIRKSQGSSKLKVNRIPNLIKARYRIL